MNTETQQSDVMNMNELDKLAKLLATEDIFIEHKKVDTANFDTERRVLTLPMYTGMTRNMYHMLVLHEIGHALYTTPEKWKNKIMADPKKKGILNVLEDARIERLVKKKYPGARRDFREGYNEFHKRDFFGLSKLNINTLSFTDRLNIHYKLGEYVKIKFSDEELKIISKIDAADTFEEIEAYTDEVAGYVMTQALVGKEKLSEAETVAEGEAAEDDLPPPPAMPPVEGTLNDANVKGKDELDDAADGEDDSDEDQEKKEEDKEPEQQFLDNFSSSEGVEKVEEKPDQPELSDEEIEKIVETVTSDNLMKAIQGMVDVSAAPNAYYDMDTCDNWKNFVVPFTDVLKECEEYLAAGYGWNSSPIDKDCFSKARRKAEGMVNYLAKEFEMQKAAEQYVRGRQSKTGVIDPNKLHTYKFAEDIFRQVSIKADTKNHGITIVIDFSSSMSGIMPGAIDQLIGLVMFCRKTNIPHRVYGFTQHSKFENIVSPYEAKKMDVIIPTPNMRMIELFTEKMSSRQYRRMVEFMMHYMYHRHGSPNCLLLGGTPLDGAALLARKLTRNLKEETGAQIMTCVFLTDGDSSGCTLASGNYMGAYAYGMGNRQIQCFVRDPKTKKLYNYKEFRSDSTAILMQAIRDDGVHLVNFRIVGRNEHRREIYKIAAVLPKLGEGMNKQMRATGCCTATNYRGFDQYHVIKSDTMRTTGEFSMYVKPDASMNQIRKAFIDARETRINQRAILTNFTKRISQAVQR